VSNAKWISGKARPIGALTYDNLFHAECFTAPVRRASPRRALRAHHLHVPQVWRDCWDLVGEPVHPTTCADAVNGAATSIAQRVDVALPRYYGQATIHCRCWVLWGRLRP
jgi:hypothetical protein